MRFSIIKVSIPIDYFIHTMPPTSKPLWTVDLLVKCEPWCSNANVLRCDTPEFPLFFLLWPPFFFNTDFDRQTMFRHYSAIGTNMHTQTLSKCFHTSSKIIKSDTISSSLLTSSSTFITNKPIRFPALAYSIRTFASANKGMSWLMAIIISTTTWRV